MSKVDWLKQKFSRLAAFAGDDDGLRGESHRQTAPRRKRGLRILRREILLDHFFLDVIEAEITHKLPDDRWSDVLHRVNIDRGDSAAALAYERERDLIHMTRQFRFPTYDFQNEYEAGNGWFTEIPAGRIRESESPEACIRRELNEELDAEILSLAPISDFYLTPGASSEKLFLFFAEVSLADGAREKAGGNDDDEYIEKIALSSSEFLNRLEQGEWPDAKTIIAGDWLKQHIFPER